MHYLHQQIPQKSKMSKERKQPDFDLREAILESANRLFLEQGYEKTSIRRIMQDTGYSPAMVYQHFRNKEDIFFTLHHRAFDELYQRFQLVIRIPHPGERLRELGRVYIDYALQHPQHYDLIFIMRQPLSAQDKKQEHWQIGERTFNILRQTVAEAMEKGILPRRDIDAVATMIWSAVHGIASLYIRDRMIIFEEADLQQRVQDALASFSDMLLAHQ